MSTMNCSRDDRRRATLICRRTATRSPMRVHWLQHADHEDLGCIAPWLARHGMPVHHSRLQPGDAAHFPPGRRIAHQVLNEDAEDAVLLVIGTDDPQDVTVFPERDRVHVRGLGATAPFQPLAYWDGEAENG